jgi:hypothetical protein
MTVTAPSLGCEVFSLNPTLLHGVTSPLLLFRLPNPMTLFFYTLLDLRPRPCPRAAAPPAAPLPRTAATPVVPLPPRRRSSRRIPFPTPPNAPLPHAAGPPAVRPLHAVAPLAALSIPDCALPHLRVLPIRRAAPP